MNSFSRTSCTEVKWGDLKAELSWGRRECENAVAEELLKHKHCFMSRALWHMAYLCFCLGAVVGTQQVRTASLPQGVWFFRITSSLKTQMATWISVSSTSRQTRLPLVGTKLWKAKSLLNSHYWAGETQLIHLKEGFKWSVKLLALV